MQDKKQMKLNTFCKEYDMSRSSVIELIYRYNLPAYKIGGRWYIDTNEYERWRKSVSHNR